MWRRWIVETVGTTGAAPAGDSADQALHQTAAFAGFAAYALMVGTVVWGILTATGTVRRHIRRETLYGGHMIMAVAAIAFIVVHAAGNVFRPAAHLSAWNATIPFFHTSTAIALGVLGAELAVVTAVSVWFQRRIGYRTWHRVHWLGYPSYGLAIVHTVWAGSDVRKPLIAIFLTVTVCIVVCLAALRVLRSQSAAPNRRRSQGAVVDRWSALLGRSFDAHGDGPGVDVRIRVEVDRNHCHRYAVCQQEAPDVFRMRVDGRLEYDGTPGPQHREAVRQAARVCPMQAITIEERHR